jgi:hypothetical protein
LLNVYLQFLLPLIPDLSSPPILTSSDFSSLAAHNAALAHPLLVALLSARSTSSQGAGLSTASGFNTDLTPLNSSQQALAWLDVLTTIPPTLPSFDLFGRLLRDTTQVPDPTALRVRHEPSTPIPITTVADLVRTEVLGRFILSAIEWLDAAEQDEREGLIADDRFAKGLQHVSYLQTGLRSDIVANATGLAMQVLWSAHHAWNCGPHVGCR